MARLCGEEAGAVATSAYRLIKAAIAPCNQAITALQECPPCHHSTPRHPTSPLFPLIVAAQTRMDGTSRHRGIRRQQEPGILEDTQEFKDTARTRDT